MKSLKVLLLMVLLACGLNAKDDYNVKVIENIYNNVILKDLSNSIESLKKLEKEIELKNLTSSKNEFSNFLFHWKSVENIYILGDFNEEFIDYPRYMDIFHNGNENIQKQLDLAISSSDELRVALFKNSLKSINALEYLLYTKDISNERVNQSLLFIAKRLQTLLVEINEEYKAIKDILTSDLKKTNGILINKLIESSYKLKEWRIADVSGLTKKYANNPNNNRAEYYVSKNSALAVKAILENYKNILDNDSYEDFGDFLKKETSTKQIENLKNRISQALVEVEKIENDDLTNAKNLYEKVADIHIILFVEMVEELQINAKILDADGD